VNFFIVSQFYRLHTATGTAAFVLLAVLLGAASLTYWKVWGLYLLAIFLHCFAFGQNNYLDRLIDSADHTLNPLAQKRLDIRLARHGMFIPLILALVLVILLGPQWYSFLITAALGCVIVYNYYSKVTVLSRLFPPFATVFFFWYAYLVVNPTFTFDLFIWGCILFGVTVQLFIIGDIKDTYRDRKSYNIASHLIFTVGPHKARSIITVVLSACHIGIFLLLFSQLENFPTFAIGGLFLVTFSQVSNLLLFVLLGFCCIGGLVILLAITEEGMFCAFRISSSRKTQQFQRFVYALFVLIAVAGVFSQSVDTIGLSFVIVLTLGSYIAICKLAYETWFTPTSEVSFSFLPK